MRGRWRWLGPALFVVAAGLAEAGGPRPAAAFSGTSLLGEPLRYEAVGERPSLLVFWASWCANCVAEMPSLRVLHAALGDRLRIYGVNINLDPADGRQMQQAHELPYPSFADPELVIADRFAVHGTPVLLLVDRSGQIVARGKRLEGTVRRALDELFEPGA